MRPGGGGLLEGAECAGAQGLTLHLVAICVVKQNEQNAGSNQPPPTFYSLATAAGIAGWVIEGADLAIVETAAIIATAHLSTRISITFRVAALTVSPAGRLHRSGHLRLRHQLPDRHGRPRAADRQRSAPPHPPATAAAPPKQSAPPAAVHLFRFRLRLSCLAPPRRHTPFFAAGCPPAWSACNPVVEILLDHRPWWRLRLPVRALPTPCSCRSFFSLLLVLVLAVLIWGSTRAASADIPNAIAHWVPVQDDADAVAGQA